MTSVFNVLMNIAAISGMVFLLFILLSLIKSKGTRADIFSFLFLKKKKISFQFSTFFFPAKDTTGKSQWQNHVIVLCKRLSWNFQNFSPPISKCWQCTFPRIQIFHFSNYYYLSKMPQYSHQRHGRLCAGVKYILCLCSHCLRSQRI